MKIKEVYSKKLKCIIPVLTYDDYIEVLEVLIYIKHLAANNKSLNTLRFYCYRLKTFYEWLSEVGYTIDDVISEKTLYNRGYVDNLTDFKLWLKYGSSDTNIISLNKQLKTSRSASTINGIMNAVLQFYNFLDLTPHKAFRKAIKNPSFKGFLNEMFIKRDKHYNKNIFYEKVPREALEYITRDNYLKCYEAATCLRDKIIIGLLFEGGLRVSEVINLQISDFSNINEREIQIIYHHDMNNPDAAVKNGSEGTIFIPEFLQEEIIKYINDVLINKDTNYFFINLFGDTKNEPMRRNNIEAMIRKVGKSIGIKGLHPHMFRHGLAVDMLSKHIDPIIIKDTLRHRNLATTMDIYADYDMLSKRDLMANYHNKIDTINQTQGLDIYKLLCDLAEGEEY